MTEGTSVVTELTYSQIPLATGVTLNVASAGPADGEPILFLHGTSQCWLAWSRQLDSDLAETYRLVAMDQGRVIAEGPPDAVLIDPAVVESYLGSSAEVLARSGARADAT